MAITIEQEPPATKRCECCSGISTKLTRFVHRDGDAYAVYYAVFATAHPDRTVHALIGLGDWGDDASPEDRTAFAVEIRVTEDRYEVMVTDRAHSP